MCEKLALRLALRIMTTFKVTQLRVMEVFFVKNTGCGIVWVEKRHLEQRFSTQIAPRPVFLKKKFPRPTLEKLFANLSEISHAK
jgi:hypothetical protein